MAGKNVGFSEGEFTTRITQGKTAVTAIEAVATSIDGTGTNTETAIKGSWAGAQKNALMEINQAITRLRGVMDKRNAYLYDYKTKTWASDSENASAAGTAASAVSSAVTSMNPA